MKVYVKKVSFRVETGVTPGIRVDSEIVSGRKIPDKDQSTGEEEIGFK